MVKLKIRGPLTVGTVAEQGPPLLEPGEGPLRLDLLEVDELDAAGLQLLLAADRRRGLRLEAISAAVAEVLQLLRLEDRFAQISGDKQA